ncbi:uncharacterized protein LOC142978710 [Anticarsia gemmatalis]|uniref:uncharacterized protein LOC142978710 n=1 Tax=Anticarsia gemmatalis TaxID=129554 RepID=UPI003F775C21
MIPHINESKDDLEEVDLTYHVDKTKKVKWKDWILLNRPLKVIIALIITAIIVPVLIYQLHFISNLDLPPSDGFSFGSCLIARESRLPCGYGDVTQDQCHPECCYDLSNDACFHRFPSRFSYILNGNWTEDTIMNPRINTVPYGLQRSFTNIRLSIDEVSETHLSLTFYKSDEPIIGRKIEEKAYAYNISEGELNVIVNSTRGNIFNTARGPFIASNDIWEMAFKITDESMYGLGEIPLKEDTVKVIYNHRGGMSSIPLIFAKSNGTYHGLLIDTMAPTEINVRYGNQLVIRSITNWGLKFHLFVGPKPADIMKDVMALIGADKGLEYWMLGAHICSEPMTTLADLQSFITTASSQAMPFESHCGLGPIVFDSVSTCNSELVTSVNSGAAALRNARKKFVPHVSPYIRYTKPIVINETEADNVTETTTAATTIARPELCFDEEHLESIINDADNEEVYIGSVDEYDVIYPKYDNVSEEFMKQLWVFSDFDAVVLENSWPLDESEKLLNETHLHLPYFNENFETAFENTPLWNAKRPERYLNTHNEYGNQFADAFEKVKDVPIMTTSQWMNGNVVVNRQNVETSWSSLQRELVEASLGGISGHRYWSSPICGDTEDFDNSTHTRLCAKWYMAATYFPLIKIHSKEARRDPLAFVGNDRMYMITALERRMSIMPYLHTVLVEGPLLRPMFYQFPSEDVLADLKTQFSVGDDLLIVPNLQPSQSHVRFWLPPGNWFEFWSGLRIEGEPGEVMTMTTTDAEFLTLIRGGSILITQPETKLTTAETQQMAPYTIIIALHCETKNVTEEVTTEDDSDSTTTDTPRSGDETTTTPEDTTTAIPTITVCSAKGKFHMSPNMTLEFEADSDTLTITSKGDDYEVFCNFFEGTWDREVWYITIYGLDDDQNNFDSHRYEEVDIDFCELQSKDKITQKFV